MSTKRKAPTKITQPLVKQNAKQTLRANVNEADTAVSTIDSKKVEGDEVDEAVIEISSDSGSSEYELSDEEDTRKSALEDGQKALGSGSKQKKSSASNSAESRSKQNGDLDMVSPNAAADGESDQEPTFGDLVRANETIDVPSALSAQQPTSLTTTGKSLAPPSLASLGTVLSQALRTDDTDLLESCLHTTDLTTVRNTIQRLDSSLAGILLTKLASRMHRRPGRAGSLMAWVQWTLIAHGGALATQPGLVKKLSELNRVLEERSRGLNSLLALKGKLDLLEAQMQLRRSMQNADDEDEDADEGVVYVEGEEDDIDAAVNGEMDVDNESDDALPVTNGANEDGSEDEDEFSSGDEDSEDDLEGVEEVLDEDEVDHNDVESLEQDDREDEESELEQPPAKKRGRNTRRK